MQLFATPWTVAHQAPLSRGILQSRTLEWVAMPSFRGSPALQADALPSEPLGKPKNTGVGHQCLWILGWVAMPSSRGSSQSRHQTQASHTVGRLFTKGSPVLQRQCDAAQRVRLSAHGCHSFCRWRPAQPLVSTATGPLPSNQLSGGTFVGPFSWGWAEWWSSDREGVR